MMHEYGYILYRKAAGATALVWVIAIEWVAVDGCSRWTPLRRMNCNLRGLAVG